MSHYLLLDSVNVSADENSTDLPKLEEIIINLDYIAVIKRSYDLNIDDQDGAQHIPEKSDALEEVIVPNEQPTRAFEDGIAKSNYLKIVKN